MSLKTGITEGTPKKLPFGAGVYFQGVQFDPLVAPTLESIKAGIIGATQEGGTLTITPELWAPELDGPTVAMKELQHKIGETAQMEVSFAELTADLAKRMVIGKVQDSTDKKYDVITSGDVSEGHFYEGFGYYGEFLNGRPVIIVFKNALCTSGFVTDAKNKANSVFKGTFACMSDLEFGVNKLPYAIYIYKDDQWEAANPENATA